MFMFYNKMNFKNEDKSNNRENYLMDAMYPPCKTQPQQLSAQDQSCFNYTPVLLYFNLKQILNTILDHLIHKYSTNSKR